jgi:hypothetical protein
MKNRIHPVIVEECDKEIRGKAFPATAVYFGSSLPNLVPNKMSTLGGKSSGSASNQLCTLILLMTYIVDRPEMMKA